MRERERTKREEERQGNREKERERETGRTDHGGRRMQNIPHESAKNRTVVHTLDIPMTGATATTKVIMPVTTATVMEQLVATPVPQNMAKIADAMKPTGTIATRFTKATLPMNRATNDADDENNSRHESKNACDENNSDDESKHAYDENNSKHESNDIFYESNNDDEANDNSDGATMAMKARMPVTTLGGLPAKRRGKVQGGAALSISERTFCVVFTSTLTHTQCSSV